MNSNTAALIVIVGASLIPACATGRTPPPLASRVIADDVKIQQLRYRVFGYVGQFSSTVEDAADDIARATSDPKVKTNALLWKMNAIPAGFTATVHPDPLAVFLDLWALSAQMEGYFADGAGREAFGPQQVLAINASRTLLAEAVSIAKAFAPDDFDRANGLLTNWVATHPLKSELFARESAVELVAPLMANQAASQLGRVGGLEDRMDGLAARAAVYAAFLPKQARWQAELMLQGAPEKLIDVQDRVMQSVQVERLAVLEAINHQRIDTLDQIRVERIAAMKDLEAISLKVMAEAMSATQPYVARETTALLAGGDVIRVSAIRQLAGVVDQERLQTVEFVHGERLEVMKSAEQIALQIADHTIREVYRLLAIVYVATILGGIGLIFLWKRLMTAKPGQL